MLAVPQAALDLPLRMLVRQREDGQTAIAYHPIMPLLRRAGVGPDLAARLEPAQRGSAVISHGLVVISQPGPV